MFGQRFILFLKISYRGQLLLLLYFIEYRLDQLNSKHSKIVVNSAIQYFEGCPQKKCRKCYFLIFAFSFTQISNDYCQKSWEFSVISAASQLFLIYTFLTMNWWLFYLFIYFSFEICTDMHFVFLFFLNERNITTSLLMIHLKCVAVHYANLNSSSKNKLFLNCRSLNMLFCFFDFLLMFILMKRLSKNLWNNNHFFIQISKIHFKM